MCGSKRECCVNENLWTHLFKDVRFFDIWLIQNGFGWHLQYTRRARISLHAVDNVARILSIFFLCAIYDAHHTMYASPLYVPEVRACRIIFFHLSNFIIAMRTAYFFPYTHKFLSLLFYSMMISAHTLLLRSFSLFAHIMLAVCVCVCDKSKLKHTHI